MVHITIVHFIKFIRKYIENKMYQSFIEVSFSTSPKKTEMGSQLLKKSPIPEYDIKIVLIKGAH